MKICIDPGHGGADPGATYKGLKEKDFTLDISLYMKERLEQLGFEVVMTRSIDTTVYWRKRAQIVKKSGASVCISNHINAGGGSGAETIYSIHSDGKLAESILQELENAGMNKRRAFSKESSVYPDRDYYYMHRETGDVETIIVEYGFIDNEKDLKKLQNSQLLKQLTEGVIKAVCSYLGFQYTPPKTLPDVNKKNIKLKIAPFINQGQTCIPLRPIIESLGGKVVWDNQTEEITCYLNNLKLTLKIGVSEITVEQLD